MKNVFVILVMLLFPLSALASDFKVYTVDGVIEAAFPGAPKYLGETGEGKARWRTFSHTDEEKILVYTASRQLGKAVYAEKDIEAALGYLMQGEALSINGVLDSESIGYLGEHRASYYTIKFRYSGYDVYKYVASIYSDGHFYSWSVQYISGLSKVSGVDIFNNYVKYFKITQG